MFPHSLLFHELTAEGACHAAYQRKAKKSTSLPREALQGAAFGGSLSSVQLCFVCRSSSRSLTLSFVVLCFRVSRCSPALLPHQLCLRTSSFTRKNSNNSFENLVFCSFGALAYTEELESNLSSQLLSWMGSFACSAQELDLVSQLCSKRQLRE